jgi:hypothetical protein|tara:strand:- start:14359 stop:15132 length:774 start_codon:yes stop_codon:yes gene_type:complete
MFYFNIWNRLKCWALNYASPVTNTGIKLFVFYNNIKTNISMKLNHYYYSNETFHNTFNLLRYLVYKVDGYFLEYSVEPIEENWINTTMYYLDNNEIVLKEDYDSVYFHKNEDLLLKTMKLKKVKFERLRTVELDNIKYFYYAKYKDKYLCKMNPVDFAISDLNDKFVSNPFIEILYVNLDNDQYTEIELDKSYFVNDNDILSTVFLKRYFDYKSNGKNFIFSQNYQLHITNFNFEDIIINKNQYVNLGDNKYTIENA